MHRLFVALRPPPDIRRHLTATMAGVPGARWQDDDQLHLTLRYIGEVDGAMAEDVAAALGQIHGSAPEIVLHGVGAFDKHGRIDALWAGVTPHAALAALHRKVDQALVRTGLEPERRAYLPHITVARMARSVGAGIEPRRWQADHAALSSALFRLDHLILYESRLTRDRAHYEQVVRWPLD